MSPWGHDEWVYVGAKGRKKSTPRAYTVCKCGKWVWDDRKGTCCVGCGSAFSPKQQTKKAKSPQPPPQAPANTVWQSNNIQGNVVQGTVLPDANHSGQNGSGDGLSNSMQAMDVSTRSLLMQVSESLGDAGVAGKDVLLAALVAAVGQKPVAVAPPDPWKLSKRRVDEANQKVRQLENQQVKTTEKLQLLQEQLAACQAEDAQIKLGLESALVEQTTAITEHNQLRSKEVEKPCQQEQAPGGNESTAADEPMVQQSEDFVNLQHALKRFIEAQATDRQPSAKFKKAGDGTKSEVHHSAPTPTAEEAAAAVAKAKADAIAFTHNLGGSAPNGIASSSTPAPAGSPASFAPVPQQPP